MHCNVYFNCYLCRWTFTIPFDVVKSTTQGTKKLHRQESSFQHAFRASKEIYAKFGIKGFFRGLKWATIRAFPVNGVLFATYSLTERVFDRH